MKTKLLISSLILLLTIIISIGIWSVATNNPSPHYTTTHVASTGLIIRDEAVYVNGTIIFTTYCLYRTDETQYGVPTEPIFTIHKFFVCTEKKLVEFDETLGDIQDTTNVTILKGNFTLRAREEVTIQFHTSFPLQLGSYVYVGVIAEDDIGISGYRWDRYTQVLPS